MMLSMEARTKDFVRIDRETPVRQFSSLSFIILSMSTNSRAAFCARKRKARNMCNSACLKPQKNILNY